MWRVIVALVIMGLLSGCDSLEKNIEERNTAIPLPFCGRMHRMCVDGYEFLATDVYHGVNLIQFWELGADGSPGPECEEATMLSENDKSWLEGRKSLCARCDCYLDHLVGTASCWDGMRKGWDVKECRMFYRSHVAYVDYADAARFEARVAAKLADCFCVHCAKYLSPTCPLGIYDTPELAACQLKHARLEVEEEMECTK